MSFKVIIAGGRDFNNYPLLQEKCDAILKDIKEDITVVSGTARGADLLGGRILQKQKLSVGIFSCELETLRKKRRTCKKQRNG